MAASASHPSVQAMIFAAGLGTRFKPWTNKHPKALALVNGKPLLQHNIEYLQQYGITDVVVNVHHFSSQLINAIHNNKGWGSQVQISNESGEVLETGGGLLKAKPLLTAPEIVLLNADILTDMNLSALLDFHRSRQGIATLAVSQRQTSRYFLFDDNNRLSGWRNNTTGEEIICRPEGHRNPLAFSGLHLVTQNLLNLISREGKFGIVELYLSLANAHPIYGFDHSGSRFIDVGKPEAVALAEQLFPPPGQ